MGRTGLRQLRLFSGGRRLSSLPLRLERAGWKACDHRVSSVKLRWWWVVAGLVLVGCGGARATVVPSPPQPTVTQAPRPTRALLVQTPLPGAVSSAPSGTIPAGTTTVINVTSPVARGAAGTVSIQTSAKAVCAIAVTDQSGPVAARGLDQKVANDAGIISWTWTVSADTIPGVYPITILCATNGGSETATTKIAVT